MAFHGRAVGHCLVVCLALGAASAGFAAGAAETRAAVLGDCNPFNRLQYSRLQSNRFRTNSMQSLATCCSKGTQPIPVLVYDYYTLATTVAATTGHPQAALLAMTLAGKTGQLLPTAAPTMAVATNTNTGKFLQEA